MTTGRATTTPPVGRGDEGIARLADLLDDAVVRTADRPVLLIGHGMRLSRVAAAPAAAVVAGTSGD